jgi:NADPH:quinone reductase-like Zn-dependent oxidoreductase
VDGLAGQSRQGRSPAHLRGDDGTAPETNINRIFWNQLQVIGSTVATPGECDDVLELVWDGTFEPRIRDVLPMSETVRAHEMLENREGFGKVVVMPDSEF